MTSMMMGGGSHHPRDSVDHAQRQAIEHLAQFVKSNGHVLEQVVRDKSRDDPKFRFDMRLQLSTSVDIYMEYAI